MTRDDKERIFDTLCFAIYSAKDRCEDKKLKAHKPHIAEQALRIKNDLELLSEYIRKQWKIDMTFDDWNELRKCREEEAEIESRLPKFRVD